VARLEIEVKLKVGDVNAMQERLDRSGARLVRAREFEDNCLYDFPDQALSRRGSMLRIRVLENETVLTFKEGARVDGGVKIREETETSLAKPAGEVVTQVLAKIGMVPVFRYQKYRTTWDLLDVHVTCDETPIGVYLEIEGDKERIDVAATALGYAPADYIGSSYRDLYLERLERNPGPADRMVFKT
jgi:adenylate cyclase class 2